MREASCAVTGATVDTSAQAQGRGWPSPQTGQIFHCWVITIQTAGAIRHLSKPPSPVVYKLCSMKASMGSTGMSMAW